MLSQVEAYAPPLESWKFGHKSDVARELPMAEAVSAFTT